MVQQEQEVAEEGREGEGCTYCCDTSARTRTQKRSRNILVPGSCCSSCLAAVCGCASVQALQENRGDATRKYAKGLTKVNVDASFKKTKGTHFEARRP